MHCIVVKFLTVLFLSTRVWCIEGYSDRGVRRKTSGDRPGVRTGRAAPVPC